MVILLNFTEAAKCLEERMDLGPVIEREEEGS